MGRGCRWNDALIEELGGPSDRLQHLEADRERGFVGEALSIEPLTEGDCVEVARLRPVTEPQGLSPADRSCLVLAARLGVPARTSDGVFADADVEAEVVLIR